MLDIADASGGTVIPAPTSPDTRAALRYLGASGARAISITSGSGGVVIAVGFIRDAVSIFWLPATSARSVAARARSLAGDHPDVEGTISALKAAAAQLRITLTEHSVAIERAHAMAERLDEFMTSMRGTGVLKEFNRTYKARRQAAFARGEQFMKYNVALARLRSAMIPVLQNGGQAVIGQSIFVQVFNI